MDEFEHFPFCEKVNTDSALGKRMFGGRMLRSKCPCCGGSSGIRRAKRKFNRHSNIDIARSKDYSVYQGESKGKKPRRGKDGWDRSKRTIRD